MIGSLPQRALQTFRQDGFRATVAGTIDYLSMRDPVGFSDIYHHVQDWMTMSRVEYNTYFREEGWVQSKKLEKPVTDEGRPIPWYTYPCIEFLEPRLSPAISVFEYGSGLSTLWYAQRVDDVVGVEHCQEWVDIIRPKLPETGELVIQTEKDGYVEEVTAHAPVDIIVIDGEHRPDCIDPALDALSDDGVVVLDDYHLLTSEADYPYDISEYDALFESDFRILPFYGPKALSNEKRCTAICYRPENCLGI